MPVIERERIDPVMKLEEWLGTDAASTLMEHPPAAGWRDLTTFGGLPVAAASSARPSCPCTIHPAR